MSRCGRDLSDTRPCGAALAEFLGTALLVTVVVGSGIAAQQLSPGAGLQLLENASPPRSASPCSS